MAFKTINSSEEGSFFSTSIVYIYSFLSVETSALVLTCVI